jgi:hypothetical protein
MELHAAEPKSSRIATAGMDRSNLNGIVMVFTSLDARWSPTAKAGANARERSAATFLSSAILSPRGDFAWIHS